MPTVSNPLAGAAAAAQIEESLENVRTAVTSLRFGSINVTVHEGRVVKIGVTEKKRLKPN